MTKSDEKRGYALKVERGERPFIYSQEHTDWRSAAKRRDERGQTEAVRAWSRRFGMSPRAAHLPIAAE
jgi:hypothetical protein